MKKTILVSSLFLAACAPKFDSAVQDAASNVVQDVPCQNSFKTTVWDSTKEFLIQQKTIPTAQEFNRHISAEIQKMAAEHPETSSAAWQNLESDMHDLYSALLSETVDGEQVQSPQQLLVLLSAIDVGDRTTPFRNYMVNKTQKLFAKVSEDAQSINVACTRAPAAPDDSAGIVDQPAGSFESFLSQSGLNQAVAGERWALATAYQSCNAARLPAMTKETPDVSGISIVGTHPDGVGSKRLVTNLSALLATDYYIKEAPANGQGCFNVRANPLIYDYGGKPYATTAATSPIDLFTNAGDGTSVLGIDCSGFVFTAYATAGLKMSSSRPLKAIDGQAWSSSTYVEPQNNGLSCLSKVTVTSTSDVKPGDIVAVYGHVFMIDSTGLDPFGINKTSSVNDCSKISAKNFDFVIAQSSNSKSGIGINRYQIKDYAVEKGGKIQAGLEKYAYYACLARYNKNAYTPNVGTLSIVRHKGTPECKATRVSMSRESCIKDCAL